VVVDQLLRQSADFARLTIQFRFERLKRQLVRVDDGLGSTIPIQIRVGPASVGVEKVIETQRHHGRHLLIIVDETRRRERRWDPRSGGVPMSARHDIG